MKKLKFTTIIKPEDRGGAGIYVPFDVKKEFGSARAKVKVTIDNHMFRSTTAVMGGRYLLPVRKEIRNAIGKAPGDKVNVLLEIDTEERIVIVPDDFQKALNKDKKAKEIFNAFAYTHRKEYVGWIESAKKPETRSNRIEKALQMISDNKKFS